MTFPALYEAADRASNSAQAEFLWLIRAEFGLLLLASILLILPATNVPSAIAYAVVFFAALGAMLCRTFRRPEQDWYKCRALAESVKTLTWRYAMRAQPFDDARTQDAKKDFMRVLKAVLDANRQIGPRIAGLDTKGKQISDDMDELRDCKLKDRIDSYRTRRIVDQKTWYIAKAMQNKRAMKRWSALCITVYFLSIVSVLSRIAYPVSDIVIEPLIVVASSAVGWMQIKKFSELASAYTLTAHEIGIIENRISAVRSNDDFSDFVNEAELAFSREHTQWVARQHDA